MIELNPSLDKTLKAARSLLDHFSSMVDLTMGTTVFVHEDLSSATDDVLRLRHGFEQLDTLRLGWLCLDIDIFISHSVKEGEALKPAFGQLDCWLDTQRFRPRADLVFFVHEGCVGWANANSIGQESPGVTVQGQRAAVQEIPPTCE